MPTDTCKLTKVGHEAILWLIWTLSPHKVHCARAACVCMCMDAHVPSHWDICGNCESAVMAKLAIKLCQGRDPSEGCNVYHRVLAQTPLSRGTWLFQQCWNLAPLKGCESESEGKKIFWPSLCCFFVFLWFHPSLMQPSIQAQVCVYCSSCPEVVNLCWWGGDRVKHRSQNTRSGRYWSMNTLLLYWHKFSKYLYFTTKYLFFGQLSNLYFFSPHSDTHIFTFTPYIFYNRPISLVLTHYRLFKTLHPKC